MRPRLLATLFVALCFFVALPARAQFVHTQGQQIVDGNGKPLLVRGISIAQWMVLEGYLFQIGPINTYQKEVEATIEDLIGPTRTQEFLRQWRKNLITKDDIDRIKRDGFNSVRIPLHTKYLQSDTDEGFQLMDQLVKWCKEDHVYIVLMMESGIGGATAEASDDGPGYPWLLKDPGVQAEVNKVWQRTARHYRNEPIIMGYDLMNEPLLWTGYLDMENLIEPEYRRMTAAIREVDKKHMLILQPARGRFSGFGQPFDSNTVYSFHSYSAPPDDAFLKQYTDFRTKYNVPILFPEIYAERSTQWLIDHLNHAEKENIGWMIWPYKKMGGKSQGPYTFPAPANWDKISAFAKQRREDGNMKERNALRPPQAETDAAFAELLENEKNAHVTIHPEYLALPGIHAQ